MSRTLFWYIFKDLLKIFLLASGVLTGIMSLGGLLRPLTEHGLGPAQVGKMLTYFWPAMTTYSLPIAALFATTMVYGRLSADNEITACRAAGISMGPFGVALPALVLGICVTIFSAVFLFFIVPVFSLKVEKVIYSNMAQLVQNQIERNHRIEMDQPGGRPLTIFAQQARVMPAPVERPRDQVVQLIAPVFVRYPAAERDARGRVVPPLDFYMARAATAFITQDPETGDLYMQATLEGGMKLPRLLTPGASKEQAMQASVGETTFYSDPIDSPVRENTKFMELDHLRELLSQPEKSRRMRSLLNQFVRDDQQQAYLQKLANALTGSSGSVVIGAGSEQYRLERGSAAIDLHPDRLIIGDPNLPSDRPPRLAELGSDQDLLNAQAQQIEVRATPIVVTPTGPAGANDAPPQRRFNIELTLNDAITSSGNVSTPRSRFERTFTAPMPADLVAMEQNRVNDYRKPGELSSPRLMEMERSWLRLTNGIISEIHARASFSVSCLILVLVGCALGMMFRSGNFLSAFALSSVPAMMSILLIITGQHTCENVPWNIKNFNNPLAFGVDMIWTGNVIVGILAIVLIGRLQRQ